MMLPSIRSLRLGFEPWRCRYLRLSLLKRLFAVRSLSLST